MFFNGFCHILSPDSAKPYVLALTRLIRWGNPSVGIPTLGGYSMNKDIYRSFTLTYERYSIGLFGGMQWTCFDPSLDGPELMRVLQRMNDDGLWPGFGIAGIERNFPVVQSVMLVCNACQSIMVHGLASVEPPVCLCCQDGPEAHRQAKREAGMANKAPLPKADKATLRAERYAKTNETYSHVLGPYRRIGGIGGRYELACVHCGHKLAMSQPAIAQRRKALLCPHCQV